MSNRETLDYDPVDALIEQGRRELADGKIDKAQWCFEEVLRRRPDEPRALLGLSYAARKSESPPSSDANEAAERRDQLEEAASVLSVDVEVVVLVREKRYEEALLKLRAELSKRPEDRALLRSIAHLEKHIARASVQPERASSESPEPLPEREVSPSMITPLRVPDIEGIEALQETQDFEAPNLTANVEANEATSADDVKRSEQGGPKSSAPTERAPVEAAPLVEVLPLVEAPVETPVDAAPSLEDPNATQPFELMTVASTNNVAPPNMSALHEASESSLDSGEDRIEDFTSSGGFQVADDEPSVPALGSLPAVPTAAPPKQKAGIPWWVFALLALLALGLVFALR